jgi:phosphocarrier protein
MSRLSYEGCVNLKKVTVKIIDEAGLHARPASIISKEAAEHDEEILLTYKDKTINLKSILGVMSLAVPKNADITISVEGDEEDKIMDLLISQFKKYKLIA